MSSHRSQHLRILGFEPFDAGSHRAVREAISRHSRHSWHWITQPGRNWKWRMRLAAAEMIEQINATEDWNAIFVTSLMSAADLRALLPAALRNLPLILYMHENQAAYPESPHMIELGGAHQHGDRDIHFALTNLTSVLTADRVLWNSEWNKRSFLDGIESLLRKGSDVHLNGVRGRIEARSEIVWPPVDMPGDLMTSGRPGDRPAMPVMAGSSVLHNESRPLRVAWPHRWEHDKGPDELLAMAERWSEELDLRWTILGQCYKDAPREFDKFERRFRARIDHMGFLPDRAAYLAKLQECDWVLSTARHEFFGIAVVEALLAGCLPWLPERLSYPELLPELAKGISPVNPPRDPDAVRAALRGHLEPAIAANAASRLDTIIELSTRCV